MKHSRTTTSHTVFGSGLLCAGLLVTALPVSAHASVVAAELTTATTSSAPAGFVPTTLTLHGGRNDQQLGSRLNSGVCDVDGDGTGDVTAVGAVALGGADHLDMAAHRRAQGNADALTDLPQWTNWTTDGTAGFTCAGDVNADGFDDLVEVTGPNARVLAVEQSAGTRNTAGRLQQNRVRRVTFPTGTTRLGERALGAAGDVNGDGAGDVLVSQHTASTAGRQGNGRVWVLAGASGPTVPSSVSSVTVSAQDNSGAPVALVIDGPTGAGLGTAVALGDVTGDGLDDLAVASSAGDVWLVRGRTPAVDGSARHLDLADLDPSDGALWVTGAAGLNALSSGDLDGDGAADLVLGLGADLAGSGGVAVVSGLPRATSARVDVVAGTVADAAGPRGHVIRAERPGDALGHSVAVLGDLDGDGRDDLVVGAPGHDPLDPVTGARSTDTGAAYVLAGRGGSQVLELAALTPVQGHRIDGARGEQQAAGRPSRFGTAVAAAGDVDGNGHLDLAISAPGRSDHVSYRQGAVTIALRGEVGAQLGLAVSRRHGDDGIPVADGAVLAASDVLDVRANLRLKTAQGVVGEVRFTVDGATLARATATPSAPHRSFGLAEELQITEVGEHVLVAHSDAVEGRRGMATSTARTFLVTDRTSTEVTGSGRTLEITVVSAVAGTPVTAGTVTVTAADGSVLAQNLALDEGTARVELPAGQPRTGVKAVYSGHVVTFDGADVTLLHGSEHEIAAPDAVRATLELTNTRHGRAASGTLVLDRAVTAQAEVLVDGKKVGAVAVDSSRTALVLPRTLGVGTHRVEVRTAGTPDEPAFSATAQVVVAKIASGALKASSTKFRKGTRPVVKVTVKRSADGAWPVGRVTVKVGGKKHTASLSAQRKGKVSVKVGKRRSAAKATVSFTPSSAATRSTPSKVTVKLRPRG